MLRASIVGLFMGLVLSVANAQEPQQPEPEKLAPPKAIQAPSIIVEPYAPRVGSKEVWQHYGVNSLGRFVPRVIVLPYGAYYSRDLQPYPWVQNRSTAVMPYAVD